MERLRLPIWVVTDRKHISKPPEHFPCDNPTSPHAFTAAEKLTVFMAAREGGRWDVSLYPDYESLLNGLAELNFSGASQICIDPDADGSGGMLIGIAELLAGNRPR
jgi:hypothetical protein